MPKRTAPVSGSKEPEDKLDREQLRVYTIGAERVAWLGDMITAARADFQPRTFAERHLVDDLAVSRWRGLRVALMEKAIFEHQSTSFRPRIPKDQTGRLLQPHEDIYHLAMAHAPEAHSIVLAALSRLDSRYRREFCNVLRLLIALRRGGPPPTPDSEAPDSLLTPTVITTNETRKENTPCAPSQNAPAMM